MRTSRLLMITAMLSLGILVISAGYVHCYFNYLETSTNLLTCWTSILWNQTTQNDFNAGVLNHVDTNSSPGDVKLAWFTGWNYRKKITIDHNKVIGNLTDFPVLINLASDSDLASYTRNDGYDILFTSADGTTKINHDIESFDGNTGKMIVWVRVPIMSSNTDTIIYMYFGNSTASDQQNVIGVWDANYAAVYHMSQSPNGIIYDSTRNHINLTSQGGMGANDLILGKIGGAIKFDGINDGLNSSSNFSTQPFTLEAWVSNNNNGYWGDRKKSNNWECIIDIYNSSNPGNIFREFAVFPNYGYGAITVCDNSYQDSIISQQSGVEWRHIAVTYNNLTTSSGLRHGYLNGAITSYSPTVNWSSITARVAIGSWAQDSTTWKDFWWGKIDEVRISNISRTTNWIATEYNNENSWGSFYTIGSMETFPTSGTLTSRVLDTGLNGALWDSLIWDSTTVVGTSITAKVRASDTSFAQNNSIPYWIDVGGMSPITYGLPTGRYKQWAITLSTNNSAATPIVHEVRTWYSHP